jgi:hypothetical protein
MVKHPLTFSNQRGQTILIVVLVMVIGATVGLSLVARSITNLRIANEQASSQQALSAAEAGVEKAIQGLRQGQQIQISGQNLSNNAQIESVGVAPSSGISFLVNGGGTVEKDDGVDVWLSDYSSDASKIYNNQWSGILNIYWGNSIDGCSDAAIEITVITGTLVANKPANTSVTKYASDACTTRGNNFSTPVGGGSTINGINFTHSVSITVPDTNQSVPASNKGFFLRIVPIYSSAVFAVTANNALPSQGYTISSTGVSLQNSQNPVKRKIVVFQGYPQIPVELFPYTLFSPN